MTGIFQNKGFLSILSIGVIAILGYFFFTSLGYGEFKYIMLPIFFIAFIGMCIYAIFFGIKNARTVYDKVLTGLIGNIALNLLFLIALYFVVTAFLR